MFTCRLVSGKIGVNYTSEDIDFYEYFYKFIKNSFMLSASLVKNLEDTAPTLHYSNNLDPNFNKWEVKLTESGGVVNYPWNQMADGETLFYLSTPYIELQLNRKNMLSAHCASVRMKNGKGILLFGKEGSGKSLTALALCQNNKALLIGNDVCAIGYDKGGLVSYYGTNFFFFRRESIARNRPDLLSYFEEESAADSWLDKVKIPCIDLGIKQCDFQDTVAYNAYVVHVDETKKSVVTSDISDHLATVLLLNENFSRHIRGTCTTMLNSNHEPIGYVPSFDSPRFYLNRRLMINHIVKDLKLQHVSGPLNKVVDYIASN